MVIRFKKSSTKYTNSLRTTENCIIAITTTVKNLSNILGNETFS
jgi:hypothetical protein